MQIRNREEYKVYTNMKALCQDAEKVKETPITPIFLMELLRDADFSISRGISYGRTVDEFMYELESNVKLKRLQNWPSMVILLDQQGALVKTEKGWDLLFMPAEIEGNALTEESDLYEELARQVQALKDGTMAKIAVPVRSLRTLSAKVSPLCILDEYCKRQEGGYLGVAKHIVRKGTKELYASIPVCKYGLLETVDIEEIENYRAVRNLLAEYIKIFDEKTAKDLKKQPKPISIAVFGTPGSGKSFGVKQIAKELGRFTTSVLNISQYNSIEELFKGLDAALKENLEIFDENGKKKIPLIFFDEFDAELNGTSRGWLKYFLAPMQDAEYTLDSVTKRIPGAVFIFAGATATSFGEFLPGSDEDAIRTFKNIKGPDFVSRLKGILNIKGPNPIDITDRKYIIRRALLLRSQINMNAKGLVDSRTGEISISEPLLSALLRVSRFRHGSRSIEFLLGMSRLTGVKKYTPSCLPIEEQLDIHLDVKDFKCKLFFEQIMGDVVEEYARAAHENYRAKRVEDARKRKYKQEDIERMMQEDNMADWDHLDEVYKEDNRAQIRYLGERFERQNVGIGIRPVEEGATDTITDLYGPVLEYLAEAEHERWMLNKMQNGWILGKRDNELKRHPNMVPYADLDEMTKDNDRAAIRNIPQYLAKVNYELYRKTI